MTGSITLLELTVQDIWELGIHNQHIRPMRGQQNRKWEAVHSSMACWWPKISHVNKDVMEGIIKIEQEIWKGEPTNYLQGKT